MRYRDPSSLVVEVWKGNLTLCRTPCADNAAAVTEADRLYNDCCLTV